MHTLFIFVNSYKESSGGIERFALNLIHYLKYNLKKEVTETDRYYFLILNSSESLIEKISENLIIEHYKLDLNKNFDLKQKLIEIDKIFTVEKIVLENFIHTSISNNIKVYNFALNKNIDCFLHLHSFPVSEMQIAITKDFDWKKIICVSFSVAGDCLSKGVSSNKLVTNHLGVDCEIFTKNQEYEKYLHKYFNLDEKKKLILHASRIITGNKDILREKGFINLLEAFHKIHNDFSNYDLVFSIASPPSRLNDKFLDALDKLKGYIEIYNLQDRVHIGVFDALEMPQVYNSADIFVLASENETFGQVVIEAMACGLPVITTNVGGLIEIVSHEYNAILINPSNTIALEKALVTYIKNPKLKEKIKSNALDYVRNKFNLNTKLNELLQIVNG